MGLLPALILALIGGILGWFLGPLVFKGVPQEMMGLVRFSLALVVATAGAIIGGIISAVISAKGIKSDSERYRI